MATGWIIERTVDLAKPPRNFRQEQPYEIFYGGDNDSATWRVHVEQNGQPVTLNGNVSVYVKRPDGMIVFTEEVLQSGNVCEVDIGYPDFIVPGYVQAVMRYTDSTSRATVTLDAFACVIQSDPAGGTIIDKDGILPETLEQLLEQIQEMQEATAAAEQAATDANAKLAQLEEIVELGYPTNEGAGAMVRINGTINAPYSDIIVYGKSVQDGAPTPETPVAIQTAGSGGTIPIVGAGRNLLPRPAGQTSNGLTSTIMADGSVTISGTAASNDIFLSAVDVVLPAGRYICSGVDTAGIAIRIGKGPNGGTLVGMITTPGAIYSLNLDEQANIRMAICVQNQNGNVVSGTAHPMIRLASDTDENFVPYVGSTASLPTQNGLPGIKVSSGGNYTDSTGQQWVCDAIDLGQRVYVQRVGRGNISAFSDFRGNASGGRLHWVNATGIKVTDSVQMLSNRLPTVADGAGGWGSTTPCVSVGGHPTNLRIYTDANNFEEFKQAYNDLVVYYTLATPVETPLTDAQITALTSLRTYKGGSTIYTTDAVQPELAVEAFIDIPTYIQQILNA